MKTKQKICSMLFTLCLIVGMFPTTVSASGEAANKAIQLGIGAISGYSDTDGYDSIYFGTWGNAPVKWKVLDKQTNTGSKGFFLLSEDALAESIRFDEDETNNVWQGSDAQKWCMDFYNQSMTAIEQAVVIPTTKSDDAFGGFDAVMDILNNDKVFFLSAEELEHSAYGFVDGDSKQAQYNGENISYWLRSPHTGENVSGNWVGMFFDLIGEVANGVGDAAARPALNLDDSTVLFTTAAVNGKIVGTTGTLSAVSDYTDNDWKLTLQDSSRNFTANVDGQISASVIAGESVQIDYSGAQTGNNEYVSALLCDSNDAVLYYGNIAQNSTNGAAELTIPAELPGGSYTLKVFSEQCNGDYQTDYASAFQEISLTIVPREATPQASFTATGESGGTLSKVEAGMRYSTDGGATWKDVTGTTMELVDVTKEKGVQVYKPGNGSTTADSAVCTITVTQADKPKVKGVDCTTGKQNNGQITGVDRTMEYKCSTASDWTPVTEIPVTGLSYGTYDVRVRADGTVLASETTTVTIGKYIPVEQKDDPSNAGGSVAGTSSPQTGDNSHLVIWFSLFVVSGIVLSGVSLYRRKKK